MLHAQGTLLTVDVGAQEASTTNIDDELVAVHVTDEGVENWSVKGMEFAAHDGRVLNGQGLSYAVANRGGDHMYTTTLRLEYDGTIDPEGLDGKPEIVKRREDMCAFRDSGIVCAFGDRSEYVDEAFHEALMGCEYEDLMAMGARVVEMERHFNNKRGMDREDDVLPYDLPDFRSALDEYYELRGWNEDGTVPDSTVSEYAAADG